MYTSPCRPTWDDFLCAISINLPFWGVLDICSTDSLDGLQIGGYHCKNSRKRHQAGKGEGVASPCQFQSMTGYSDGSTVMTKKIRKRVAK